MPEQAATPHPISSTSEIEIYSEGDLIRFAVRGVVFHLTVGQALNVMTTLSCSTEVANEAARRAARDLRGAGVARCRYCGHDGLGHPTLVPDDAYSPPYGFKCSDEYRCRAQMRRTLHDA